MGKMKNDKRKQIQQDCIPDLARLDLEVIIIYNLSFNLFVNCCNMISEILLRV